MPKYFKERDAQNKVIYRRADSDNDPTNDVVLESLDFEQVQVTSKKVTIGPVQPADAAADDIWIDTSGS